MAKIIFHKVGRTVCQTNKLKIKKSSRLAKLPLPDANLTHNKKIVVSI